MSKHNNLDSIDEQIIKLQERKKLLQAKQEKEIGKYLLKSWNVSSLNVEDIFKLIDLNKPTKLTNTDIIPTDNKDLNNTKKELSSNNL
ncbi:MAG TPA: hypothetical protein VIL99_09860 [Ignavibacteria bacterium]